MSRRPVTPARRRRRILRDTLLLAGKGHETYQVLKEEVIHLDEREVVASILADLGKENPSCN